MPPVQPASGEPLVEFLADMRRLRAECDWKRAQTHRSLARYLLEETHETLEVLDGWDDDALGSDAGNDAGHLSEELGDLLLQVYFHAAIAEERGDFTLDDVARGLIAKMRRRNPHVFGDAAGGSAVEINEAWQAIKAAEKPDAGITSGLPVGLPALLYADKVLDRLSGRRAALGSGELSTVAGAAEVGDAPPAGVLPGSGEPATASAAGTVGDAPPAGAALGDRLLALVAEAHAAGVDPEQELRDAVRRLLDAAGD